MLGSRAASDRLRIKICGITTAADAHAALEGGADAIGLNCFHGSKRYLDLAGAAAWLRDLPPALIKVAVLVNAPFEEAVRIARLPFIDALQLHGQETPEFCARLSAAGVRFGKALPAVSATSLDLAGHYSTATIVLDSVSSSSFGGTGTTFPWPLAHRFVEANPDLHVVLAGGLHAGNVAEAVRAVRPFGVDVTTGVESSPGRKDHQSVRRFIAAARAA